MTPTPAVRARVAAAALALAGYAACADQPAPQPYNQAADTEKQDHHNTDQADREFAMRLAARLDDTDRRIRLRARASRSTANRSSVDPQAQFGGDVRNVTSTAYCLTGTMANGQPTHHGAAAMNGVPLGSQWEVVGTDHVYTVADRIGHGSQFDIAMPGDCAAARAYGRRTITVRRVG